MDIIANQPVPGQRYENSLGSLYSKYNDLTQCKNIRSATTFLASHHLENDVVHNSFFQQMVAKFPATTTVHNWLMPHQSHLEWFQKWIIPIHINEQFSERGYANMPIAWEWDGTHDQFTQIQYESDDLYFTPNEFSQKIFGAEGALITKDPVYLQMIKEQAQLLL